MTSPCPGRGSAPPLLPRRQRRPHRHRPRADPPVHQGRRRGQVDQEVRGGRRPLRERRRVPPQHLADAPLADQAPLRGEERRRHPHGRLPLIRPRPSPRPPVRREAGRCRPLRGRSSPGRPASASRTARRSAGPARGPRTTPRPPRNSRPRSRRRRIRFPTRSPVRQRGSSIPRQPTRTAAS
ncbi:MAG: hypothetical protein M0C28_03070 [Candidatus Moduliflexus flocculans]|nr:hypothetical protein [Candidatus Moduliflexus flocculans]